MQLAPKASPWNPNLVSALNSKMPFDEQDRVFFHFRKSSIDTTVAGIKTASFQTTCMLAPSGCNMSALNFQHAV